MAEANTEEMILFTTLLVPVAEMRHPDTQEKKSHDSFVDDKALYRRDPRTSIRKLLEIVGTFI